MSPCLSRLAEDSTRLPVCHQIHLPNLARDYYFVIYSYFSDSLFFASGSEVGWVYLVGLIVGWWWWWLWIWWWWWWCPCCWWSWWWCWRWWLWWWWCWRWGQMDGSDWWAGCWTCLISSALPKINNGIQADQGPGRFLRTLPGIKCIKESKKAHDVPGAHLTITLHPIIRPLPTICASLHPSAQRFDGNMMHVE